MVIFKKEPKCQRPSSNSSYATEYKDAKQVKTLIYKFQKNIWEAIINSSAIMYSVCLE